MRIRNLKTLLLRPVTLYTVIEKYNEYDDTWWQTTPCSFKDIVKEFGLLFPIGFIFACSFSERGIEKKRERLNNNTIVIKPL